jgi:hypothetical protein
VSAGEGQTGQQKAAFMGDIRQKLAQVADAAGDNEELSSEVEGLAASAATRLFLARKAGTISGDELSGFLGDVFGYKPKADGTPGKTPAGAGATDQDAYRSRASGLGFRQRRRRWPLLRDDGRGGRRTDYQLDRASEESRDTATER